MVKIYCADLNDIKEKDWEILNTYSCLPIFQKCHRYRIKEDFRRSFLGRFMLMRHFACSEDEMKALTVSYDINTRPYISFKQDFNITHSEDKILLAISTKRVGIDIEFKNNSLEWKTLTDYFTDFEKNALLQSKTPLEDFYNIWVKKEAVFKTIGLGLQIDLKSICCVANQNIFFKNQQYHLLKMNLFKNYTCYLCSTEEISSYEISHFSL